MGQAENVVRFRVRYGETDQMGTFSHVRALDWFECGRTELLRGIGTPYAEMERRGVFLPVVEANVRYRGRAHYDDLLTVIATAEMSGRARIRCEVRIVHADGRGEVAVGYTVHAFTDESGKPIRPPKWFLDALASSAG